MHTEKSEEEEVKENVHSVVAREQSLTWDAHFTKGGGGRLHIYPHLLPFSI